MPGVKKGKDIQIFFRSKAFLGLEGDPIRIKGQCPPPYIRVIFYYVNGQSVVLSKIGKDQQE